MKPWRSYHEDLITDLKDPEEAIAYLNAALEAADQKAFLLALRNVAEAHGSMTLLSRRAKLHRVSLYKMLSKKGNPSLGSLMALMDVLGVRLFIGQKQNLKKAA